MEKKTQMILKKLIGFLISTKFVIFALPTSSSPMSCSENGNIEDRNPANNEENDNNPKLDDLSQK